MSFARDVAHGLRDALPPPHPARAPQPVERRRSGRRAGRVLLEKIQPVHRQEELSPLRVVDLDQFGRALLLAEARHPDEAAHPVVGVNDRISGFQIAEIREETARAGAPGGAWRRRHHGRAADHLEVELREFEPGGQPPRVNEDPGRRRQGARRLLRNRAAGPVSGIPNAGSRLSGAGCEPLGGGTPGNEDVHGAARIPGRLQ